MGEFEFTQRRGDGLWRSDSATRKQRARPVSGAMHLQKGKCVKPLFRSLLLARALILDDRCCAAMLLESSALSRSEWEEEKKHSNHHRGMLHYYTTTHTHMHTGTHQDDDSDAPSPWPCRPHPRPAWLRSPRTVRSAHVASRGAQMGSMQL